jgi:hypothetical protein
VIAKFGSSLAGIPIAGNSLVAVIAKFGSSLAGIPIAGNSLVAVIAKFGNSLVGVESPLDVPFAGCECHLEAHEYPRESLNFEVRDARP